MPFYGSSGRGSYWPIYCIGTGNNFFLHPRQVSLQDGPAGRVCSLCPAEELLRDGRRVGAWQRGQGVRHLTLLLQGEGDRSEGVNSGQIIFFSLDILK